ncbi:PIN domain-containing protein [Candidatus Bathyarchaeota archaeon]|nr:PIN domain-containing protein [Candidatus Bathyarchaeota archaeon]
MKVVLDTYPLIIFFKNEAGAEDIQEILYKIEKREIDASISTLTLSEIFYILARYVNMEFATTVLKYIRINLKRTPVTDKIAEKGGQYKFKYAGNKGMPLADAIIAATAFEEKAVLISGEKHFKKIEEIEAKSPKEVLQRFQ